MEPTGSDVARPDERESGAVSDAGATEAAAEWAETGAGAVTSWPWPPIGRVLDPEPVASLDAWVAAGGGKALEAARAVEPITVIEAVEASGLRGRGGAGFPTGTKWRSIASYLSDAQLPTVVVNGAEGEPGSYKDRTILRNNPYRVIEGALIAAAVIGADEVVLALKEDQDDVTDVVRQAVREITDAGWAGGATLDVVLGPSHYLYGEETALLEVINGREPFPRTTPPWRRGATDIGEDSGLAAEVDMAGGEDGSPPALVDNVETLANIPAIVLEGPEWFRSIGTDESPGSLVVTVSGAVNRAAVAEVAMGTSLRDVVEHVGGGVQGRLLAVLPGVSNAIVTGEHLDVALTYEDMAAAGSGLGSGAYLVVADGVDPVALAHGASRFLAVESCGQCTPCKADGLAITGALDRLRSSEAGEGDLDEVHRRLDTISDGARCSLAGQHELVVRSILAAFGPAFTAHQDGSAPSAEPYLVAEVIDLDGTEVRVDLRHADKQPDWTYDEVDSGATPVDRLGTS